MTQPNDASKKSPRTFQCRDQLWETFEQMARELECSIDYLVNEAMKQYARQRSYGAPPTRTPYPPADQQQPQARGGPGAGHAMSPPQMGRTTPIAAHQPHQSSGPRLPPPPPGGVGRTMPLPPPPGGGRQSLGGMPPQPQAHQQYQPHQARGGGQMPPPAHRGGHMAHATMPVPPPPSQQPQMPPPMPATFAGGLTAVYQGERTTVSKERFIIGRGRQTSDLTIKDPNVSRQHAMIEFQNGVFYMVDLGSTNGVEYHGQRVTRKAIAEGDVFRICDHEVAFTFR